MQILSKKELERLVRLYRNPYCSVRDISKKLYFPYKDSYLYARQAIEQRTLNFSRKEYLECCRRLKNSCAKTGKKNPNYNSKLVDDDYRKTLSEAMTGKKIPPSVRQQISKTKRSYNGYSLADKL
jgi:hypothetical protein